MTTSDRGPAFDPAEFEAGRAAGQGFARGALRAERAANPWLSTRAARAASTETILARLLAEAADDARTAAEFRGFVLGIREGLKDA